MCAPTNVEKKKKRTFDDRVADLAAYYKQLVDDVNRLKAELDELDARLGKKKKGERKRKEKKYSTTQLEKRKAMLEEKKINKLRYAAQVAEVKADSEEFKRRMLEAQKERKKENPELRQSTFEIDLYFSNPDNCYAFLEKIVFPDGIVRCRHCDGDKCYRLKTRRKFTCANCKQQFSILKDTIFEHIRFGIAKMFKLLVAENNSPNKLTLKEVKRLIGVSFKTALKRLHDIRHSAFSQINTIIEAGSTVHFDTTAVIGANRNRHWYEKLSQMQTYALSTLIAGFRQINGPAILNVIPGLKTATIYNEFKAVPKSCTVYTDGHKSTANLSDLGFNHASVNHSIGEYGRGRVNSNGAESLFMVVKKVLGAHQKCFKYIQLILNAITHEFNADVYQLTDWEKIVKSATTAMQVLKPSKKKVSKPGQFKLNMLRSTILAIQPKTELRKPVSYSTYRRNKANKVSV